MTILARELQYTNLATILIGIALPLFTEESISLASTEWLLMSCHVGCAELQNSKRKVPDLGEIRDPTVFVKLMREKGHQVIVSEVSIPNGKVVEVKMPDRKMSVMCVNVMEFRKRIESPAIFFASLNIFKKSVWTSGRSGFILS